MILKGVQLPSDRTLDPELRGPESSLRRHIKSLEYWLIPRKQWLCVYMTEKLLNGTISLNSNKIKTDFCVLSIELDQSSILK